MIVDNRRRPARDDNVTADFQDRLRISINIQAGY